MDQRKPENRVAQGGVLDGKRKHDNQSQKRKDRRMLGVLCIIPPWEPVPKPLGHPRKLQHAKRKADKKARHRGNQCIWGWHEPRLQTRPPHLARRRLGKKAKGLERKTLPGQPSVWMSGPRGGCVVDALCLCRRASQGLDKTEVRVPMRGEMIRL